jgi:hypothetical protein
MTMPRGRGRLITTGGSAVLVARCPLCRQEHRYGKGPLDGEEVAELRDRGFSDEWLPCQGDLPGNFWRVILVESRPKGKQPSGKRAKGATRG